MSAINEKLEILNTLYQGTARIKIECEQELADFCEDVNRILRIRAKVRTQNVSVYPGSSGFCVQIGGRCEFNAVYLSHRRGAEGGICSADFSTDFSHEFNAPVEWAFDDTRLFCQIEPQAENAVCRPLGPRKLQLRCDLSLQTWIKGNSLVELRAGGKDPQLQERLMPVKVSRLSGCGSKDFELSEETLLPPELPPVERLLDCSLNLYGSQITPHEDRVQFTAHGVLTCSYLPESDQGTAQPVSFVQPLEIGQAVECVGCRSGHLAQLCLLPADVQAEVEENTVGEKRKLRFVIQYGAWVGAVEEQELSYVEDCYSPFYQLKVDTACFNGQRALSCREHTVNLEFLAQGADESILSMEEVYGEFHLSKCEPCSEGIRIKGKLLAQALANKEDGSCTPWRDEFSAEAVLSGDGLGASALEGVVLEMSCGVKEINCHKGAEGLTVRAALHCQLWLIAPVSEKQVIGVEKLNSLDRSQGAGVVVYYPDPHETPWSIGKSFGVPMADIECAWAQNGGKTPQMLLVTVL